MVHFNCYVHVSLLEIIIIDLRFSAKSSQVGLMIIWDNDFDPLASFDVTSPFSKGFIRQLIHRWMINKHCYLNFKSQTLINN